MSNLTKAQQDRLYEMATEGNPLALKAAAAYDRLKSAVTVKSRRRARREWERAVKKALEEEC